MKEKREKSPTPLLPGIFLALQVIAAILWNSGRATWVFVNITLGVEHFTFWLLCFMILNAVFLALLCAARVYKASFGGKKAFSVLLGISAFFSVLSLIFGVVSAISMAANESAGVYLLYLKDMLVPAFFFITVPLLAVFFPKMPCKARKIFCSVILVLTFVIGISQLFPLTAYKITSNPVVIDNGSGYSVVFSTNDKGTGYVEYSYEGKDYKVYDTDGGKLNTQSTIHSMEVPYEHLRNNSYSVGSVRVIEAYSYGSRLGKEVSSQEYRLEYNDSDEQTWLVISDWHTMLDTAYAAVDYLGEYDSVILLGDASPGIDFEQEVVRNIVQFGGEVSEGTKPVLYIRGNHETRGNYASELGDALGLEEFYYTADAGPYSFVVLDSGEDKDDSHPEYGGTTDYNTYRADMIEWLSGVEAENEKVISLCHSWTVSDVETELSDKGWQELDRIGTRLMISGHEHQCRALGEGSGRETEIFSRYPHIAGYLDGGKSGKDFIATKMSLSAENIELISMNNRGEKVCEASYEW